MARVRFLEPSEVAALLDIPNPRSIIGIRNRTMMMIMAQCGLRISEVRNLRPRDVSVKEQRIIVQNGKGANQRVVYWSSNGLSDSLRHWEEVRPPGEYLFVNVRGSSRGTQVSSRNIQKALQMYGTKAGIQTRVTPHMLRHSFATQMLRSGVSIRILQEALGHRSVNTTQIYCAVTNKDVQTALRGF